VTLVGVVEDLHRRAAVGAQATRGLHDRIPCLLHQLPRQRRIVIHARPGEGVGAGSLVGGDLIRVPEAGEVRHDVRRRYLPASRDLLHDLLLVDGEVERAAHPHVVERRLPGVERVPVEREKGVVVIVLLRPEQRLVLGRERGVVSDVVDLARLVEVHRRVVVLDLEPHDPMNLELVPS
jgi:hypothetical protein